jgi:CTP-dependent riboflavin kinase
MEKSIETEPIISAQGQGRTGSLELFKDKLHIMIEESFTQNNSAIIHNDTISLDDITIVEFHKPKPMGQDGYIVIKYGNIEKHIDFSDGFYPMFNAINDYIKKYINALARCKTECKILTLRGTVSKGVGKAASNLINIQDLIAQRSNLGTIFPGTLNIRLNKHYPIIRVDGIITDFEYGIGKECIKLKKCKLNSIDSVIIRPSYHENPYNDIYWNSLEIMSSVNLRDKLKLKDNDKVSIEVEDSDIKWE